MIQIKVNNLDSALKQLKFKFDRQGTKKELMERKEFKKPCVAKREMLKKAAYKQWKRDQERD